MRLRLRDLCLRFCLGFHIAEKELVSIVSYSLCSKLKTGTGALTSGVFTGGWWGFKPPMTAPTKIFSIEFNMVYSVLCVTYAVSLAQ
jgi:hypothetical protein